MIYQYNFSGWGNQINLVYITALEKVRSSTKVGESVCVWVSVCSFEKQTTWDIHGLTCWCTSSKTGPLTTVKGSWNRYAYQLAIRHSIFCKQWVYSERDLLMNTRFGRSLKNMITWCSDSTRNVAFGRKTYAPEAFNKRKNYKMVINLTTFFQNLKQTEILMQVI